MNLPELPTKRKTKETDKTPKIRKWFKENWKNSYALEIKVDNRRFANHQISALKKVAQGVWDYKLPDTGFSKTPFDVVGLQKADALAVIFWIKKKELEVYNYTTKKTTIIAITF